MTNWLVIVAGPNGAGKSTFVETGVIQRSVSTPESPSVDILNPDALAIRLAGSGPVTDQVNLAAAEQVEIDLHRAIGENRSIGVETVLSSPKYRTLVQGALDTGFRIMLHYVLLAEPDLHTRRVAQRVAQGGHSIPADKIADRYIRSLNQLPWFAKRATRAFIWDNSSLGTNLSALPLVAEKSEDGEWVLHAGTAWMHPAVDGAMQRILASKD
jgi:predicted ABC-type ATPase